MGTKSAGHPFRRPLIPPDPFYLASDTAGWRRKTT